MSTGRVLTAVLGLVLLGVGLGTLPESIANRDLAAELLRRGTTVRVDTAEAYLVLSSGTRAGRYLDVEKIRVRVQAGTLGLSSDRWVELEGVSPEAYDDPPPFAWVDHWVQANDKTGYAAPLSISLVLDGRGEPRAMALSDVGGWQGPDNTVLSLVAAGLGLLLLGLVALVTYRGRHRASYLGG